MSEQSNSLLDLKSLQESRQLGLYVKTFGCQMNEWDSEKMVSLLSRDYAPVSDPEQAELILINTCSVRDKAEHKLFSLLGKLSKLKRSNPNLIIGVGGCVAQQEGKSIIKRSPSVDFVVGTHNLSLVPSLVQSVKNGLSSQVAVDYREDWEDLPSEFDALLHPNLEVKPYQSAYNTSIRALVAIQRGCSKNCSFCVVPSTRGPEVSRSLEEVLRELKTKIRLGAREVMFLGQTVNSYGRDLNPRIRFEKLIFETSLIDEVKRIRFTSPHPAEFKQSFIELYSKLPKLCPHIHLPLQSGSDKILRDMNRNYRIKRYMDIIEQLKLQAPNIAITTDIIVGFPGETDEDFEHTLRIMKEVNFSFSYSFKYSIRPNTVAKQNWPLAMQVPEEVKSQRLLQLQDLQESLSLNYNKSKIGHTVEVLVESKKQESEQLLRGRTPDNILIDVAVDDSNDYQLGELVYPKVSSVSAYGLKGTLVN